MFTLASSNLRPSASINMLSNHWARDRFRKDTCYQDVISIAFTTLVDKNIRHDVACRFLIDLILACLVGQLRAIIENVRDDLRCSL